jgi:hypothetical protein
MPVKKSKSMDNLPARKMPEGFKFPKNKKTMPNPPGTKRPGTKPAPLGTPPERTRRGTPAPLGTPPAKPKGRRPAPKSGPMRRTTIKDRIKDAKNIQPKGPAKPKTTTKAPVKNKDDSTR